MKQRERDEAIARLIGPDGIGVKPGDTIYTVLRHRSSSGMFRVIDMLLLRGEDEAPLTISWNAAHIIGYRHDRDREGLRVSGAGMDMGFHIVNSLSEALFGRYGATGGYDCLGDRCPSNAHVNDYTSSRGAGVRHADGYALRHRWL